jgi:hypothetical protein
VHAPAAAAAAIIGSQLLTGSLLCSAGDCLAVRIYTASPYTHVAIAVVQEDGPWVYDSMNGVGVRKLPLADYLATQAPDCVRLLHPASALNARQARTLEQFLDSQLGRPYDVMHHLTGRRCEGLHCSEYVTDALMSIELIHAERPPKVSPATLIEGITTHAIYDSGALVHLQRTLPERPAPTSWCARLWRSTTDCCSHCCDRLSGWFLCR